MTDDDGGPAAAKVGNQAVSVGDQPRQAVSRHRVRLVGQIAATTIRRDNGEPAGKVSDLMGPAVPAVREPVQQEQETLAMTSNCAMQTRVTHVDPLVSDRRHIGTGHDLSLGEAAIDGLYNHDRSKSGKDRMAGSSPELLVAQQYHSISSA